MSTVRRTLNARDRVELLCWLTTGSLGAFYLNESWPDAQFHVQSAHKWLDRRLREADWLEVAKISGLALDIARQHDWFVHTEWARDAVEEILETDDLNWDARLVKQVMVDCERVLADKRMAD